MDWGQVLFRHFQTKNTLFCEDVKTRVGERVGWGIHYDPALRDTDDFDDKSEQPVLCYVSKNMTIEYARMMMQPEGGWYPAVVLNSNGESFEHEPHGKLLI